MPPPTPGWLKASGETDLTLWLADDVPMFFRGIDRTGPRGCRMGERGLDPTNEPPHTVHLSKSLYLATFPVTQHQWRALAATLDLDPNPSHFKQGSEVMGDEITDLHPVERVGWNDCARWCDGLTRAVRYGSVRVEMKPEPKPSIAVAEMTITLPTEAQWEYCCRAGTETEYGLGDGVGVLDEMGWFGANSGARTHAVGEKLANKWGLHDMHGNVWEWCADAWDAEAYKRENRYDGCVDPEVRAASGGGRSPDRVVRGGSWGNSARYCRSALRFRWYPGIRGNFQGFRCCLLPGPVAKP